MCRDSRESPPERGKSSALPQSRRPQESQLAEPADPWPAEPARQTATPQTLRRSVHGKRTFGGPHSGEFDIESKNKRIYQPHTTAVESRTGIPRRFD